MIKGIIFDSGGTLVDTTGWKSDEAYRKYVDMLASLGFKIDVKKWKAVFEEASVHLEQRYEGSPMRHQIGLVFLEACRVLGFRIDPSVAMSVDYGVQHSLIELAKNFPGTVELLQEIKAEGYSTCMVANGSVIRTSKILESLGLSQYMDFVIVSEQVGYEKYTGIPFKRALARMRLSPEEVIAVGDNPKEDISGAKKAGLKTVHIGNHRECKKYSPDHCIKKLSEIQKILGRKEKALA